MKTLISLPKIYKETIYDKIDGVILGIKNLSIGFNSYETQETILNTIAHLKSLNKEIFISLNKNMYNKDLEYLKKIIKLLNNTKIDGIIYYDISVYTISKELNIDIPLYWNQEHLTTNYMTCNFWNKRGVLGTFLSSDITIEEIEEIKKKTNSKLIVQVYGYTKMMASSRNLITNYLKHIGENKNSNKYEIYESVSKKTYPILEDENGTITLSDKCLNGIKYIEKLKNINIDYVYIDGINIDNMEDILNAFKTKNLSFFNEIEDYFLSKKTIYKVKK